MPLARRTVIALCPIVPQNKYCGIVNISAKLSIEINLKTFFVYIYNPARNKFACMTMSVNLYFLDMLQCDSMFALLYLSY